MRHHHLRHHSLCWAEQVSLLQGDSNHYGDHDSWQFFNKFNLTLSFMVLALRPYLKKIMSFVVAWYKEIQNQVSDHKIWTSRSTLTLSCGWPLFCPSVPPLSLTFSYSGQTHEMLILLLHQSSFAWRQTLVIAFHQFQILIMCSKRPFGFARIYCELLSLSFDMFIFDIFDIFIFWYVYLWLLYLGIYSSLISLSFDIFIFWYLYLLIYV